MSKQQWIAEHELIEDQYLNDLIERGEAVDRFRGLGLDEGEIDEILDEIDLDAGGLPHTAPPVYWPDHQSAGPGEFMNFLNAIPICRLPRA